MDGSQEEEPDIDEYDTDEHDEVNDYIDPNLTRKWSKAYKRNVKENPMFFWDTQESRLKFKYLRLLAKKTLIIQSGSSAAERLFSSSGTIVTRKRTSLNIETVAALVEAKSLKMSLEKIKLYEA